jgi:hypothetical protein
VAFICAIAVNWWIVSRYGYRRAKASTIAAFNSSVQRTIFWIKYPFVLMAYLERKRRRWKIIVPPVWLSPAGLMARDLELYVTDEGKEKIDVAFIDGLAKSRDETLRIVKKQLAISAVIFLFLFANYLAIETDVNIAGFSLKYAKGIPEGLMLISSLLSSYTLILQSNAYLLESAIKVLIGLVAPPELRELYEIQYFPHEHFGGYKPFNLPHITQSKITLALNKYAAIFFLVILVSAYLLYLYCYALLVIDMWQASRLGFWSKAIAAYMGLMGIGGFLFLAVSRMRLRYLDYTINQEFELLRQIAPERVNVRLQQVYGELNEDRQAMIRRGYLKQ